MKQHKPGPTTHSNSILVRCKICGAIRTIKGWNPPSCQGNVR